ncbi:MAG: T9SS type A sorting domain-containing protein, partial [bacterium]
ERDLGGRIESYNVYKIIGRTYDLIGNVPVDETSVFLDYFSTPDVHSDRYAITAVDTCGNESAYSPFHETLHLSSSLGTNGQVELSWNLYKDESNNFIPEYYYIYRGSKENDMVLLDKVSGLFVNSYTDTNPLGSVLYKIAVEKDQVCNPANLKSNSGPFTRSLSNLEDNRQQVTGLKTSTMDGIHVYPNPFSTSATVTLENHQQKSCSWRIMDIMGKTAFKSGIIKGESFILEKGQLEPGFYILEIQGDKIFRKNIIIE